MVNRTWRISVRSQLFAAIAAVVVSGVVFQVTYFPARLAAAELGQLETKAHSVATTLAHACEASLQFDDAELANDSIAAATDDPDVAYIALFRTDGSELAGWRMDRAPPDLDRRTTKTTTTTTTDDLVSVRSPVAPTGAEPGMLVIGYSTATIRERDRANRNTTLAIGALMLVGGLTVAFALGTTLGNRVARIARASEDVARGRLETVHLGIADFDEIGVMALNFERAVATMKTLEGHVRAVAAGDLAQEITVEGDLAAALRDMISSQRALVREMAETTREVDRVANELLASASQQETGANEQAAVVEETLLTTESVLASARNISDVSRKVLDDAESTLANNQAINERIALLARHTERIGEFLGVIKDIANKTDLLALNAALEGTRAGEAGRGFSQVAARMQALTESVMGAVRDIRQLTLDIRESTTASVLATEEGTKRASSTANSARQISLITDQQRSGTQQMAESMDQISRVIRDTVSTSAQHRLSADRLSELSTRLGGLVRRFDDRRVQPGKEAP